MGRQIKNEMDEEAAVAGHINRSRRYLNDMFEQGGSILVNMAGNRERIKVMWVTGMQVVGLGMVKWSWNPCLLASGAEECWCCAYGVGVRC